MPTKPSRPCLAANCPNPVASGGYCSDHATLARRYDDERADDPVRRLYKTRRWQQLSAWWLRGHPFCAHCGRRATVTDHVIAAHVAPEKFFDSENLSALCVSCNTRKGRGGNFTQTRATR